MFIFFSIMSDGSCFNSKNLKKKVLNYLPRFHPFVDVQLFSDLACEGVHYTLPMVQFFQAILMSIRIIHNKHCARVINFI